MTVSTITAPARIPYAGNGTTTAFAVTFPFFDTTDLVVTLRSSET